MAHPAYLGPLEPACDQRAFPRRSLKLHGRGERADRHDLAIVVRDLSRGGFLIEAAPVLTVGEELSVHLGKHHEVAATVAWQAGALAGCRFNEPLTQSRFSAALLESEPCGSPWGGETMELALALAELHSLENRIGALRGEIEHRLRHCAPEPPASAGEPDKLEPARPDVAPRLPAMVQATIVTVVSFLFWCAANLLQAAR